jgi:hypothetical protein
MSSVARSSLGALALVAAATVAVAQQGPGRGQPNPESDSSGESAAASIAEPGEEGVRAMGGTSVIGNREVPKSLYIVPWKNSEVGVRTDLSRDLLDEGLAPVDPNEFERQVQFYEFHQQQ